MLSVPFWEAVENRLGSKLAQPQREYLETKFLQQVVEPWADADIEDAAEEARNLLGAFGHDTVGEVATPSIRPRASHPLQARISALSELLASMANDRHDVRSFRIDVLGGALLRFEEVVPWVTHQATSEGTPTTWLTASWALRDDSDGRLPLRPPDRREHHAEVLHYAGPGDSFRRVVGVNESKSLGRLRRLSVKLAQLFCWTQAQATIFVLTGLTPRVQMLVVSTPTDLPVIDGLVQPWGARLRLDVDPSIPPEEVVKAYARARREVLRHLSPRNVDSRKSRRLRLLDQKAYSLAVFSARRPSTETWRQSMIRWNSDYPEWSYAHRKDAVGDFRREAMDARTRTLDPYCV